MLEISGHAGCRLAQRNLSQTDIEFIVHNGSRERRAGAIFCQMTRRALQNDLARFNCYARLVGTTVVLCSCGQTVITVYRNERAFKKDRRKAKYEKTVRRYTCEVCGKTQDVP